jgi:hypothetical protein
VIIARNGKGKGKKYKRDVSFRTAEIREIGESLASLGLVRIRKGEALNVRRRESLRRALAEAGAPLRWSEVAALSDDPVAVAAGDVKKLVRSGAAALERTVSDELADKKAEAKRLMKIVEGLRELAEDPDVEYPTEFTYTRTARGSGEGFVMKTETLTLADSEEVLRAARKIEKSLPNWAKQRDEVMDDLRKKQETIKTLTGNLSDLVESWRGVLQEVLVTMPQ